jgi:hypothetical protein
MFSTYLQILEDGIADKQCRHDQIIVNSTLNTEIDLFVKTEKDVLSLESISKSDFDLIFPSIYSVQAYMTSFFQQAAQMQCKTRVTIITLFATVTRKSALTFRIKRLVHIVCTLFVIIACVCYQHGLCINSITV